MVLHPRLFQLLISAYMIVNSEDPDEDAAICSISSGSLLFAMHCPIYWTLGNYLVSLFRVIITVLCLCVAHGLIALL